VEYGKDSSHAAALGASLKDAADTRSYLTTADLRAQRVIFDGLRAEFPGLALVGEEDKADRPALFNLGTSLWDTYATEACLAAGGGSMTSLLGTPLEHARGVPPVNFLGVVATSAGFAAASGGRTHLDLCANFVAALNGDLAGLMGGLAVDGTAQPALQP